MVDEQAAAQLRMLEENCREFGVPLFGRGEPRQGVVHVMGPELGLTLPGMTIVCGDSHTATHGAFGALAFGIGTSEVEHVLASQCLLQQPAADLRGPGGRAAPRGVSAKDLILGLMARIGVGGGTGHVFEYTGPAIRALDMEERMTVCNMSIEGGARAGLIAPDDVTFQYLAGRPAAPKGRGLGRAVARWRTLPTDPGATFDQTITLDASALEPMITWGTNPGMGMAIGGRVPDPASARRRPPARRAGEGPRLHGARSPAAHRRPEGRRGLHRQLHQRPHLRPPRRRLGHEGAQGAPGSACSSSPAPGRQGARPRPRGSTGSSSRPAPSGATRAARCASP